MSTRLRNKAGSRIPASMVDPEIYRALDEARERLTREPTSIAAIQAAVDTIRRVAEEMEALRRHIDRPN